MLKTFENFFIAENNLINIKLYSIKNILIIYLIIELLKTSFILCFYINK